MCKTKPLLIAVGLLFTVAFYGCGGLDPANESSASNPDDRRPESDAAATTVDAGFGGDERADGAEKPDGGVSADGDWSCLGKVQWARSRTSDLEYTGRTVGALAGDTIDVDFEVCPDASEASCADPVVSGSTGSDGTFTGTIPMGPDRLGFDGYARIAGGGSRMETMIFFNPPITENEGAPVEIPVVTPEIFRRVTEDAMGVSPKSGRGHVAVEALDCAWARAPGVELRVDTSDGTTTRAYLRNSMVPSTSASQTDASGLAGFVNVPPGRATVSARVAATDEPIGSVEIFVEAGAISEVAVAPTPSD